MKEHVRIRKDYTLLVRAGKLDEAQKILEYIWDRKGTVNNPINTIDENVQKKEAKKIDKMYNTIDDLSKIKGIGVKTVKDIKIMFNSMDELIDALRKNRVALRDDIVDKLNENLIL